jgi:hypothetical protein
MQCSAVQCLLYGVNASKPRPGSKGKLTETVEIVIPPYYFGHSRSQNTDIRQIPQHPSYIQHYDLRHIHDTSQSKDNGIPKMQASNLFYSTSSTCSAYISRSSSYPTRF